MSTNPLVCCPVCKEDLTPDENLEQHLIYEHEPRELARRLVAEWEARELGDCA